MSISTTAFEKLSKYCKEKSIYFIYVFVSTISLHFLQLIILNFSQYFVNPVKRFKSVCIRQTRSTWPLFIYFLSISGVMVPAGSWISAPTEAIILGLKELPHCEDPISQRHIFFAHAYKVRKCFAIWTLYIWCTCTFVNFCWQWHSKQHVN